MGNRTCWPTRLVPTLVICMVCGAQVGLSADDPPQSENEIASLVASIRAEGSPNGKIALANKLIGATNKISKRPNLCVSDVAVSLIASLLTDSVDLVRIQAATALGGLGPCARRAAPELKQALAEATRAGLTQREQIPQCNQAQHDLVVHTGPNLTMAIIWALEKIAGEQR